MCSPYLCPLRAAYCFLVRRPISAAATHLVNRKLMSIFDKRDLVQVKLWRCLKENN
jgi:hypothetical protein